MKSRRWAALGILAVLAVGVVLVVVGLLWSRQERQRALDHRPLVLIHAPLPGDRLDLGSELLASATARARAGVSKIELWADGVLVEDRESEADEGTEVLPLAAGWTPTTRGPHLLVVRAVSAEGVEGQSSVAVEVVEPRAASEAVAAQVHLVRSPEETVAGIADAAGTLPLEIEALNPGLPADLVPGDVLVVPAGDRDASAEAEAEAEPPATPPEPPEAAPEPGQDEGADGRPVPQAVAPESTFLLLEPLRRLSLGGDEPEPADLRVEALALETDRDYEAAHCYVGVGDEPPRWLPDADGDPATDESFASLGAGAWDVAAHLSGQRALAVPWPENEPLSIAITCVGIADGGTDARELGTLRIVARPEAWDGLTRRAVATGPDGGFTLEYRIGRAEEGRRGHPIFLDPTMTPPTDLRMGPWTLQWDYAPRADEEPIHGFRVYLNGALQWVELPDARASTLPYEWLSPPCGTDYDFTVTAFRYGYPDGPESPPSNTVTAAGDEPGSQDCGHTLVVRLDTLSTEYLERDMGALYGTFYVNDRAVSIDGRCDGPGICGEVGLYADYTYDVPALASELGGGAPARFVVDVPPTEPLVVGFEIHAEGEGLVCAGETWFRGGDLDRPRESAVDSERPSGYSRRCRLSFRVQPAFGSAVAGTEGDPPLPMLMVEDLTVDDETGQLTIHVRNAGAGTWPGKDLEAAVVWPDGSSIGTFTWPDLFVRPGERKALSDPALVPRPHPPLGACVILDPGDRVPEEDGRQVCDETGECMYAWRRGRYCRPLPDLTVTDARYDEERETLLVTVENVGEGSVEHRDLGLEIELADGRTFTAPGEWWSDVSISPRGRIAMAWSGIGPGQRALMTDGYTAVIDPFNDLAEEDGTNNRYDVRPSTRLWLSWTWIGAPYSMRDDVEFHFEAHAVSAGPRRTIADWRVGQDIDWGSCFRPYHCVRHYDDEEYDTYWVDIAGDEDLVVEMRVSHPGTLWRDYQRSERFSAAEGWGGGSVGPRRSCGYLGPGRVPNRYVWQFDTVNGNAWNATFHICREDAE